MSILSTSSKLVRVGDSYSAGEGISIDNNVISVTGDYGHSYSAGENISISDDNVISSKDWSSDIDTAAQNVSAETTAWVSEQGYITDASLSDYALITDLETTSGLLKMDIDTVSGSISGKMDTTAFNNWQTGQYSNDIGGLSNDIQTVSGAVDAISGAVSSLDIPTHQEIIDASGYAYSQSTAWCDSQGYLTEHQDISNLATKDEVSAYTLTTTLEQVSGDIVSQIPSTAGLATTGQVDTASSFLSGAIDYVSAHAGDEFPASANDAITAYQTYSGTYLTKSSADTLYQPIGSYALQTDLENVSGDIVGLIPDVSNFITNTSAETTYQPIGNYASATDITGFATKTELETTSGEIVGLIPSTAGLATETDLQIVSGGLDYISGVALTAIPTGTMNETAFSYDADDLITAYNGSAFAGQGGGSVDTIPVAVISPLVTGFSGESAYLGIESTALNLSSYVPVSAIGVNSQGYVSGISGKNISAYYSRNSLTSNYSYTADRAYHDRNNNEITSYYQPKLTITGDAGTITSINGSAVGASIPEGWELVAGTGISIVDDAENNQTTISVTAAGGNPEVESYVQTNSASIDDAVLTYQTNSGSYITQETDWTNTITAASSYAFSEATALIPTDYYTTANPSGFITNVSAENTYQTIAEMTAYQPVGSYATTGELDTASSFLSGSIDYVSGSLTGYLTTGRYETDSANWEDATTVYQTNSASYLTSHQAISAEEWNSNYDTVNSNSSTWTNGGFTGEVYGISGVSPNVDVYIDQQTLWISAGGFLTAHQDLSNYATTSDLNYVSGVVGDVETLLASL